MAYLEKVIGIIDRAKHLGDRLIPNGGRLVGRTPHVAPEAWLHEIFGPLPEQDIQKMEMEIKRSIPPEFRQFLKEVNGLLLFSCSLSIYGFRSDCARSPEAFWQPFSLITPNTIERPKDAKESIFCIGGYSWDGSRIYIDSATSKVFRAERRKSKAINEWDSFGDMLVTEAIRLALLFDDNGHRIDENEPTIPVT